MALDLTLKKSETEGELKLSGRMDATTAPAAQAKMLELGEEFDSVVLDFSELEYISSAGLRALKALRGQMRKKGGKLALKSVTPGVMEVFEVTGFSSLFTFI